MSKSDTYSDFYNKKNAPKSGYYLSSKFNPLSTWIGFKNFLRHKMVMSAIKMNGKENILDIACASGYQVFEFAKKTTGKVIGVDIVSAFIETAKEHNHFDNVDFICAKGENIPLQDNSFDIIFMGEVLEHVIKPDKLINECSRLLKKDGSLFITVPNLNSRGTLFGRMVRFATKETFKPLPEFTDHDLEAHGDAHLREYNIKSIRKYLEDNNYFVFWVKGIGFIDFPVILQKIYNKLLKYCWPVIYFFEALFFRIQPCPFLSRNIFIKARKILSKTSS